MNVPFIMVVAYIVLTIVVSVIVSVKDKGSSSHFLTAAGTLPWFLIIPLLFAEMMAGAATIGKAATGYTTGITGVWVNWGMSIGMIVFIVFAARFYRAMHRKYNVLTIPEAFNIMFDRRCRMVMLAVIIVVYMFLFSSQPISAASLIAPMIGVDSTLVAWVVSAILIAIAVLGGMKGIAVINVVHMVVMYAGLIWVTSGSLDMVGGFEGLVAALPGTYFDLFQPSVGETLANAIGTGISFMAAAVMVTGCISSRSAKDMAIGTWGTAAIIIPFATLPALVGMCAFVVLPGIDPNTALFSMANLQGDIVSGAVSMAVAAAIWSSASAALLFCANTLTQDFFVLVKPESTDKQRMLFCKAAVVVIGIIATILGLNAASILGQLYAAFQIRSVVAVVLLVAIFWPRVSSTAAFWSMLGGGVLAAAWHFAGSPFGLAPLWPACGFAVVLLVAISLASKEKVSPGYKRYLAAKEDLARAEGKAS